MSIKLKMGQPVNVTPSRSGVPVQGRFAGTEANPFGSWVKVNMAEKGKPADIRKYRPKQVEAA